VKEEEEKEKEKEIRNGNRKIGILKSQRWKLFSDGFRWRIPATNTTRSALGRR
jgi:hypothetical protein